MTLSTASNSNDNGEAAQRKLPVQVRKACPYVGLSRDPETWLDFADAGNCCHYARPGRPIDPDHQEAFCLSEAYDACPMLEQPEGSPLLPALRASDVRSGYRSGRRALLLVAIAIVLFAVGLFAGGWLLGRAQGASSPTSVRVGATVDVETLTVRTGPGLYYAIRDQVPPDESLTIIGRNDGGDWWQICCVAGEEGWIFNETVIAEGDTEAIPVVPAPPTPLPTPTAAP